PSLGFVGVMSAKNTAVNILILTTFMSFMLYRRTGKVTTVAWAKTGHAVQLTIFSLVAVLDILLYRAPKKTGEVRWGRIPAVSQYVLIFIAVTFTWLMGLMGYVRSGLRQ